MTDEPCPAGPEPVATLVATATWGDPELDRLAARVVCASRADREAVYCALARAIRERRRFDLVDTCTQLQPQRLGTDGLRETVLLLVDAGRMDDLASLLAACPDARLDLPAGTLLRLLRSSDREAPASAAVLADGPVPHAAATAAFNAQAIVIARQRSLIERLLAHLSPAR